MKAIDTNVLIRFLTGDDPKQAKIVYSAFKKAESEKSTLYISLLVVLEMIWILESVYDVSRAEILDTIHDLLLMPIFRFDQQTAIRQFVRSAHGNTSDLSDLLIAHSAYANGCETVLTFDKKASKYKLFELLI